MINGGLQVLRSASCITEERRSNPPISGFPSGFSIYHGVKNKCVQQILVSEWVNRGKWDVPLPLGNSVYRKISQQGHYFGGRALFGGQLFILYSVMWLVFLGPSLCPVNTSAAQWCAMMTKIMLLKGLSYLIQNHLMTLAWMKVTVRRRAERGQTQEMMWKDKWWTMRPEGRDRLTGKRETFRMALSFWVPKALGILLCALSHPPLRFFRMCAAQIGWAGFLDPTSA